MAKYKIVKGNIIKSDFELEYEPDAFTDMVKDIEKKIIELNAQKKIYDAKADNVARNHPHVLKIEEKKRNAIWMYHENFVASIQASKMIKGLEKSLRGTKSEMKEIEKQCSISF